MKANVKFWKNWDSTYGAEITVSLVKDLVDEFPTNFIFTQDGVDIANIKELHNSEYSHVNCDFQTLSYVVGWSARIIADIQKLVDMYDASVPPADFSVEILRKTGNV